MAKIFEKVKRGDLITAKLMNDIIDEIEKLDKRVTALESSGVSTGAPIITEVLPAGQVRLGDELTVRGLNFMPGNIPPTVIIGNVQIKRFNREPEDTTLIFNIPLSITGTPNDFLLMINNGYGTDVKTITILAEQIKPTGRLVITDQTGETGAIEIGSSYIYWFDLTSETTIAETYSLSARFTNPVGDASASSWQSNSQLVNQSSSPLSSNQLSLRPGRTVRVGIRVTIPAGAISVDLAIYAQSMNNDEELSRSSTLIPIVIGQTQPVSDPRVSINLRNFGPVSRGRIVQVNGVDTIEIPYQGFARVSFFAEFEEAGHYEYSTSMETQAVNSWSLENLSPTESTEVANGTEQMGVNVRLLASAPASGTSHPEAGFLIIRANRTNDDEIGQFESFARIPIRGYVNA